MHVVSVRPDWLHDADIRALRGQHHLLNHSCSCLYRYSRYLCPWRCWWNFCRLLYKQVRAALIALREKPVGIRSKETWDLLPPEDQPNPNLLLLCLVLRQHTVLCRWWWRALNLKAGSPADTSSVRPDSRSSLPLCLCLFLIDDVSVDFTARRKLHLSRMCCHQITFSTCSSCVSEADVEVQRRQQVYGQREEQGEFSYTVLLPLNYSGITPISFLWSGFCFCNDSYS